MLLTVFLGPERFAKTSTEKLVIFLHGYGSNGNDLISIADAWQGNMPTTTFFSPNAIEPWEGNAHTGYQWFGLIDLNPINLRRGLDLATSTVASHIKQYILKYQISEENLALVGFSQGAMLALDLMFHFPKLAGVVAFAGAFYPPTPTPVVPSTSALLIHGMLDTTVPYLCMLQAEQLLKSMGITYQTHTCRNLGHGIDESGINAAGTFLQQQLYKTITKDKAYGA
jgi:phospholipase/carboxylesterase